MQVLGPFFYTHNRCCWAKLKMIRFLFLIHGNYCNLLAFVFSFNQCDLCSCKTYTQLSMGLLDSGMHFKKISNTLEYAYKSGLYALSFIKKN